MAKASPPPILKTLVLNAENLFVSLDRWDGTPMEEMDERRWQGAATGLLGNKPLAKVRALALAIRRLEPDVVLLTEVGGLTSLENFNRHFLGGAYAPQLLEGNSDRGIDMGFLVRAPWGGPLRSHREHPLAHPVYTRFSRDVLLLELTWDHSTWFNVLLVHLKSKLNMKGDDFEGRTRRAVEVRALAELARSLGQEVPLLLGGDFNGDAHWPNPEPEFLPLYHGAGLRDVAELAGVEDDERFSHIHFRGGRRVAMQLDYLFLNAAAQKLLHRASVQFPRYTDESGTPLPIPQEYQQKRLLPSDHFPLYAEFDLTQHPFFA